MNRIAISASAILMGVLAGSAWSQDGTATVPDVVGLRLGMTVPEVIQGMKATVQSGNWYANLSFGTKSDPSRPCELLQSRKIGPTGMYFAYGNTSRNGEGYWLGRDPDDARANQCPRLLIGLQVMAPPLKDDSGRASEYEDRKCSENETSRNGISSCELIYAEFSPAPKQERAVLYARRKFYRDGNPSTDDLVQQLVAKYGTPSRLEDTKYGTHGRMVKLQWIFDAKNRLVDKRHPLVGKCARGLQVGPREMRPALASVEDGCYVTVAADISGVRNTPQLVEQFAIALFHSGDTVRAMLEREKLTQALQQRLQQEQVRNLPSVKEKL